MKNIHLTVIGMSLLFGLIGCGGDSSSNSLPEKTIELSPNVNTPTNNNTSPDIETKSGDVTSPEVNAPTNSNTSPDDGEESKKENLSPDIGTSVGNVTSPDK